MMKDQNRTPPKFLRSFLLAFLVLIVTSCTGTPTPVGNTPSTINLPTRDLTPTKNSVIPATETPVVIPTEDPIDPLIDNPEDLEGISVRFLHALPVSTRETIEEVARQFSLTNPWGIWVEVEAFGSETLLLEALQSDLDQDDLPGLFAIHPINLDNLENEYPTVNLSAYLKDATWGFTPEEQADFSPIFVEAFTQDDELTALPVTPTATVLFYNKAWGEALGFAETPTKEASFKDINCAATDFNLNDELVNNDGTGGWLINFDPVVLLSWYHTYGGDWQDLPLPAFDNETGRNAFGTLKSLYDQGCIWIGRRSEPYSYFADRIALMYAGTLEQIPIQTGWMELAENDDQWSVVGFPGPEGQNMLLNSPGLFISETSREEQLAAWLFAKHLSSPDVEADLIESSFSIPVRKSTMNLLADFIGDYPQWAQGVALLDKASFIPNSDDWELGQWVLQDAIYQILLREADQLPAILEELDRMIGEVTGE